MTISRGIDCHSFFGLFGKVPFSTFSEPNLYYVYYNFLRWMRIFLLSFHDFSFGWSLDTPVTSTPTGVEYVEDITPTTQTFPCIFPKVHHVLP